MQAAVAALATLAVGPAFAGCAGTDTPCTLPDGGSYHITLPDGSAGPAPVPAVVFLHGAGSSGAAMMRMGSMASTITGRGYAFVAPDGAKRAGSNRRGWSFHPDWPERRDETAFLKTLIADLADRHHIDADAILLAGFSIGGSMVAYTACKTPDLFAAYAPVAGNFWRPHPTACAGPVKLLHTHGWKDGTVPLEGRPLPNWNVEQGDVFHAMTIWRQTNGCDGYKATKFNFSENFWQRSWTRCAPGTALSFALHKGGHGVPKGWSTLALDWFETLPQPPDP